VGFRLADEDFKGVSQRYAWPPEVVVEVNGHGRDGQQPIGPRI
jgi:hypothetical protein